LEVNNGQVLLQEKQNIGETGRSAGEISK